MRIRLVTEFAFGVAAQRLSVCSNAVPSSKANADASQEACDQERPLPVM